MFFLLFALMLTLKECDKKKNFFFTWNVFQLEPTVHSHDSLFFSSGRAEQRRLSADGEGVVRERQLDAG